MKNELAFEGFRAAWSIIATGQRIVRLAERMEEREQRPYTWRCNLAWRLMTLGARVMSLGETLEVRMFQWAQRLGCDMDMILAHLISSHGAAEINSPA